MNKGGGKNVDRRSDGDDVENKVEKIVDYLCKEEFTGVICAVNNFFEQKQEKSSLKNRRNKIKGKTSVSDPQGKTALYKLMQTVKALSRDCLAKPGNACVGSGEGSSGNCSKAVAKIYASISAMESRRREAVFTLIKGVFDKYVVKGGTRDDLWKRLSNFEVFLELVVANAG